MTLARFLHISVNLVSPTTPTALRKSRELLKQVRHPPAPLLRPAETNALLAVPGARMRQPGDNTWHRCGSGMPLQPAAAAASHPRRRASLSQSRLPPGTPVVTPVTPQAPAVLRVASPGPGMGGGAPRPASRRPPPLRGRLGAAGATASPARSIRRAASPPPGPRRAPGPHRTWAGSGTRNWTGRPPPPRPRAAGSSGPPWPLRSRRRPGSGVRASARRPAARPVRGSAARRCPLGRGAAAAEAAGSGPHGAHHPPPGTAAAPLPEGAAGLSPGAPPPRTA